MHRLAAGPKLLLFAVIALTLSLLAPTLWMLGAALALVVAVYAVAGLGARELGRQLWTSRWLIVIMLVPQLIVLPPVVAVANTGRVVAIILLAAAVTLTTRVPAVIEATERGLGWTRRFGGNPALVGLVLALTITTIPVIAGFATVIREAQAARGARMRLTTFVVPLLVMSLRHADDLGDALAARGVE
nr:CbiQ family ECF transporter T component [Galbitalea soli]